MAKNIIFCELVGIHRRGSGQGRRDRRL